MLCRSVAQVHSPSGEAAWLELIQTNAALILGPVLGLAAWGAGLVAGSLVSRPTENRSGFGGSAPSAAPCPPVLPQPSPLVLWLSKAQALVVTVVNFFFF